MKTITIKDIYDFALANKGTKTFMGIRDERILMMIKEAVDAGTLFYHLDSEGRLAGFIIGVKDDVNKVMFVSENLAMSLATLRLFAAKCRALFPNYSIEAFRHGCHRKFNTQKLYNKLQTL